MKARAFALSFLLVALAGCTTIPTSAPRIDGSTPAAFETSRRALVTALNSEQQAKLNTAILLIGATKVHDSGFNEPTSFGPETLRRELDGKTYEEIIKAAAATGATISNVSHRGVT
jgi:hypothetical protein